MFRANNEHFCIQNILAILTVIQRETSSVGSWGNEQETKWQHEAHDRSEASSEQTDRFRLEGKK